MLLGFVILYLILSIAIGVYAATRVKSSTDYALAGRSLPIYIVTATVFATWFGSETVLGISARFTQEGLGGVVEDPFGASLCLIFVGMFFAARLYRMNLMTIGDFYRQRYNRTIELVTSVCIIISYLGWVSAQISALGLVFNVLTDGQVSREMGMIIGASIVLLYTIFGGMWSVALTDFFQMILIVVGMLGIGLFVADQAGGVVTVVNHAAAAGKLKFLPEANLHDVLWFIGAAITMMLGSIPQQDVFQRVMSAKDEKTAVRGSILGGGLYFLFAFIPMFLAYAAFIITPDLASGWAEKDAQMILPSLVLSPGVPLIAQVLFFGALLSAIMSTASGTLLAPSITFTENILKGFLPHQSDQKFLWMLRVVVFVFAICVTVFALRSDASIYEMVSGAYQVPLVGAFIPLVFGLYWKRANSQGAMFSIMLGISSWLLAKTLAPEGLVPPQLLGFAVAFVGMVVGSLIPPLKRSRHHPAHSNAGGAASHHTP
jgi:solute:Na+ symporter, SSS family